MREPSAQSPRGRRPPPTPPGEPGLDHLSQAPEPLVRAILLTLCDDERVKSRALRYFGRLLRFEEAAQDGGGGGPLADDLRSPTSGVPAGKNARKRRKTGNPRICVQCDAIFVDDDNEPGACRYHAGVMQLFDVTKIDADWDVTDEEDVDTDANRAAFPDAFRWLCCDAAGSRPGCRRGQHEANPELSRKGRGSPSASAESSLERDPLRLDEAGVDGGLRLRQGRRVGESEEDEDSEEDGRPDGRIDAQAPPLPPPPPLRGLVDRPLERRSVSREESARRDERRREGGGGSSSNRGTRL